jgi:hypothetical protein
VDLVRHPLALVFNRFVTLDETDESSPAKEDSARRPVTQSRKWEATNLSPNSINVSFKNSSSSSRFVSPCVTETTEVLSSIG